MNARQRLAQALETVEARLAADPPTIALRFERAGLLAALGRTELAKQGYLGILHLDPTHFGTLNNFGTLLYETGFCAAARTVYTQAVTCHPESAAGAREPGEFIALQGRVGGGARALRNRPAAGSWQRWRRIRD